MLFHQGFQILIQPMGDIKQIRRKLDGQKRKYAHTHVPVII